MKNILGRKVGMTSVFTDDGQYVPVTVIEAGPCTVVERRDEREARLRSRRSRFRHRKKSRVTRALAGHFKKANVEPARYVREFRTDIDGVEVGQTDQRRGVRSGRPRRRDRHLEGPRLCRRHQASQLQRRRREPRLDDPSSAGLERRYQRRTHASKAAAVRDTTVSTAIDPSKPRNRSRRRGAQSAARSRSGSRIRRTPS